MSTRSLERKEKDIVKGKYILKHVPNERRFCGFPAAEVNLMDFRLPKTLSPTSPFPGDVRIGSEILHVCRILSAVRPSLMDFLSN
jgi:hypothetical protein